MTEESYAETPVKLHNNSKIKYSIALLVVPLSCKQAVRRVNYQAFYWLQCTKTIYSHISIEVNSLIYN